VSEAITRIDIQALTKVASGKVREIYDLEDRLLFIASDRISAFDCILPDGIPQKGRVLTQLSDFWFKHLGDEVSHHVISMNRKDLPLSLQQPDYDWLDGRFMIVKKLKMLPVECVVRGYLAGSGYREYRESGAVCGESLPEGLELASKLPQPIFTPATKATDGHDINISFQQMAELLGRELSEKLRDLSIKIYQQAADYALQKGVIIADTKFEFGLDGDQLVLADEVLTPDSSRYWPVDAVKPGHNPPSFDKQYVRDYLDGLDWDKTPPAPALPEEIIDGTQKRYLECFEIITGMSL
jgi:phosphoribosylaminoimidazole-succinocarboxamide synthase